MSDIRRKSPRRPYTVTPEGIRRVVLGGPAQGTSDAASPIVPQVKAKPQRQRQEPADWHVAIAHAERGDLDEHARQVIAAAAILAKPATGVLAIILGAFNGSTAALGADAAIVLPEAATSFDPERKAALCAVLIGRYRASHVFLADKADGDGDLGRRLAADFGLDAAAEVVELSRSHALVRWAGGAGFARRSLPRLVLLAPGTVDASLPFLGAGELLSLDEQPSLPVTDARIRDLGTVSLGAAEVPLEEADFIVSAGNGVERMSTLNGLAGELGAAVGASRVAVDAGKCARHQQIGATGKTVNATTYIAIGISGAVQHLMGIRDCRHVIAINRDAGAPIAGRADLTIVGDAEPIMRALLDEIAAARRRNGPEAA